MTRTTSGKVALVTGATDGIGLVTARELAVAGVRTFIVGRSDAKGDAAVESIRGAAPGAYVTFLHADLSSLSEIAALSERVQGETDRLDILMNNAGATFTQRGESVDGLEMTFALNHMAYFALTIRLADLLRSAPAARVVSTASVMHRWGRLDFDDLQFRRGYGGVRAYSRSKLCNVLFSCALARRLAGINVTSNAVHPGVVRSNFANNNGAPTRAFFDFVKWVSGISVEAGARTGLHVATSPEAAGQTGLYFVRSRPAAPSRRSLDRALQDRLWTVSAEIAKIDL